MAFQVILSRFAEADLDDIVAFISQRQSASSYPAG
jgi:plasmid stabilization system protein ParE